MSGVAGTLTVVAGAVNTEGTTDGDGTTGTSARFNYPIGLTCVGTYLYFSDGHSIRRMSTTANYGVTTMVGAAGTAGLTDNNGTSARLRAPGQLIYDGSSKIFFVDVGNHNVREYDTGTTAVTTRVGPTP